MNRHFRQGGRAGGPAPVGRRDQDDVEGGDAGRAPLRAVVEPARHRRLTQGHAARDGARPERPTFEFRGHRRWAGHLCESARPTCRPSSAWSSCHRSRIGSSPSPQRPGSGCRRGPVSRPSTIVHGPITSQRMDRGMHRSTSRGPLLHMAMMRGPPHLHETLPAGSSRP